MLVKANGAKSQCFAVVAGKTATIRGAVKLNGLPVPIPSSFRSRYDTTTNEIG